MNVPGEVGFRNKGWEDWKCFWNLNLWTWENEGMVKPLWETRKIGRGAHFWSWDREFQTSEDFWSNDRAFYWTHLGISCNYGPDLGRKCEIQGADSRCSALKKKYISRMCDILKKAQKCQSWITITVINSERSDILSVTLMGKVKAFERKLRALSSVWKNIPTWVSNSNDKQYISSSL